MLNIQQNLDKIKNLTITGEGTRTAIIGSSGTGKSTAALTLISKKSNLHWLIVDLKNSSDIEKTLIKLTTDRIYISNSYEKCKKKLCNYRFVIYRPTMQKGDEFFYKTVDNNLHDFFLTARNVGIFFDEAYLLENGVGIKSLMTQSRSKKISIVACTQRPVSCPKTIISESDNFFCFRLNLFDDRKVVEKNYGLGMGEILELENYFFLTNMEKM